jgi:hypothetical protein
MSAKKSTNKPKAAKAVELQNTVIEEVNVDGLDLVPNVEVKTPVTAAITPSKEALKVEIKALNRAIWPYGNGDRTRYPKCLDTFIARPSRAGYVTGLTKAEADNLEQELRLEPGTLSPLSDFWKDYVIRMPETGLKLDMGIPGDRLKMALLKIEPRVANSVNERTNWPKAEYVVFDAEEDAKLENAKIDDELTAMSKFANLSNNEIKDYLKLLGKATKGISPNVAKNVLYKIAKDTPKKFNDITKLPNFNTLVLVHDLVENRIIRINGGYYYFGEQVLAYKEEATATFLDEPKNQQLKIALKQQLDAKIAL